MPKKKAGGNQEVVDLLMKLLAEMSPKGEPVVEAEPDIPPPAIPFLGLEDTPSATPAAIPGFGNGMLRADGFVEIPGVVNSERSVELLLSRAGRAESMAEAALNHIKSLDSRLRKLEYRVR